MQAARYGLSRRGRFHIIGDTPTGRMATSRDFDALCGATAEGRSPCTMPLETARKYGFTCKRCERVASR